VLVEACVETAAQASAAAGGGADRVELCRRLEVGGLTPRVSEMAAARAAIAIPLHVLIRPRVGDFVYTAGELREMVDAIGDANAAGADGVVIGALTTAGRIDEPAMRRLLAAARPLTVTCHRAFDGIADQPAALEVLVRLGVDRVLTSGGASTALEGADRLRQLVDAGAGRIVIMAGGGIRPANVAQVVRSSGVREVHARTDDDSSRAGELRIRLGR
jgi:copper homeostasis protein